MCTLRIGRGPTLADVAVYGVTLSSDTTSLTGRLDGAASTLPGEVEQVRGYAASDEVFVPVAVTPCALHLMPVESGFYRVESVSVKMSPMDYESAEVDITLTRVRGFAAPIFESVVLGSKRVSSSADVTPLAWHAVPASATGYETGVLTPTRAILSGETGDVQIFSEATNHLFNARPMWFLNAADWYDGAPELTVAGHVVTGRQVRNAPADWVLSNGLVRFVGLADGGIRSERWDGAAWSSPGVWRLNRTLTGSSMNPVGAPHTLTVLRNDPACVTIRVAYDAAALVPGSRFVVLLDLSLRRGSTVVEATVTTRGYYMWGFYAPVVWSSAPAAHDSFTDGTFVAAGGTADLGWFGDGSPVSTSKFVGAETRFVQWGWGYLAGRTQQQVAQMYAAAQSERTEVVAR
ncbi:MAG: hypothetical protein GX875_00885 [Propionibacterium sp.]|nr:hypothetical protein [Propionibacterium sp.]